MWSLTLPQVPATLAATLVAFDAFDAAGHRLIDDRLLDAVLVLMLTTSILGPVLTERFAPRLLEGEAPPDRKADSTDVLDQGRLEDIRGGIAGDSQPRR